MKNEDVLGVVMFTEEEIKAKVSEMGKRISEDHLREFGDEPLVVVCILKGAYIFTSDLFRSLSVDARVDFMAASSYGGSTESSGKVTIKKDLDTDIKGKNILIVEDIIDTGRTLHYLVEMLWERQPNSIKVCTLIDKPERRVIEMKPDYIGFKIEDKFIVGYGLDYDEKYRHFPYITCLD